MAFEYFDLSPELIERFRETIPDIGGRACLVVNRMSGYWWLEWEDETTRYEYDPSDGTRRHRGKGEGCVWTAWE